MEEGGEEEIRQLASSATGLAPVVPAPVRYETPGWPKASFESLDYPATRG